MIPFLLHPVSVAETSGFPNKASPPQTAAIAGGVVGAVVFVSFAMVLVMIAWKRKYQRYEKPQPRREDEGSHYTELQPPPFANSEDGIVNYANTEPRSDLSQPEDPDSYVNVETTQNTYEQIQPRLESTDNNYSTLYSRK
ncbi:hypothetical protein BaRGS_00030405 [Batillaria attramentaria]|uniref:Uncharacterized protein n=1 Tax=Batillaria attramentaria TaxID=370345 RepID=A0ABD0JU73_9CAEN